MRQNPKLASLSSNRWIREFDELVLNYYERGRYPNLERALQEYEEASNKRREVKKNIEVKKKYSEMWEKTAEVYFPDLYEKQKLIGATP